MRPRRPVPTWFLLALLGAWVALCHALDLHTLESSPVSLAFFGWLIAIGQLIWSAVTAASTATVAFLSWSVNALWIVLTAVRNGLAAFGRDLLTGFKASWSFLRRLYDDVLKPAWVKVWRLVDRVHDALDRLFRPVFQFLRALRSELLAIYAHWVRPILDTIQIARAMLRVLSTLHVGFAKRLDAELAKIEQAIDRPFRFVLGKLNEVINVVNRIVTLDGFFQRLTLARSLLKYERDVWAVWWSSIGKREAERVRAVPPTRIERTAAEHGADYGNFLALGDSDDAALAREHAADYVLWLDRNPVRLL